MASSPPSRPPSGRRARLIAAAGCAGLLGAALAAPTPRGTEKIVLEAVPVTVDWRENTALLRDVVITQGDIRIEAAEARVIGGLDFENGEWTISGNVRINAEGGSLRSDKAVVSFRNNAISQAVITGTPAVFEQQRRDGTTSRGRAKTIDYETGNGTVRLRDDAWMSDGCNEISGQQLVYNIRSQSVQGQEKTVAWPDGRIRITIQPRGDKNDSGNPCVRTEPAKKP